MYSNTYTEIRFIDRNVDDNVYLLLSLLATECYREWRWKEEHKHKVNYTKLEALANACLIVGCTKSLVFDVGCGNIKGLFNTLQGYIPFDRNYNFNIALT